MQTTRHATYNLNDHIVWTPKCRQSVLVGDVATRVRDILHEVADERGSEIINQTVQAGTTHLFVSGPPKHVPSFSANETQGVSLQKYNHCYADHDGEKAAGHVSSEIVEKYIQWHTEGER